jgi:VWFA-related protein
MRELGASVRVTTMATHSFRGMAASLAMLVALVANPAAANVFVRVEGRPQSDPIQAFVRVTDINSEPVTGLPPSAFTVKIDGNDVAIGSVTPPSGDDPTQHVSVVFVMDYTSSVLDVARDAMESAVNEFIDQMAPGDWAAIIKFNNDSGANVIAAFTEIDDTDTTLHAAVLSDYPGDGSNILDATDLGVSLFVDNATLLPAGPKAVILVTDGIDTHSDESKEDVIGSAGTASIPIFTIGVGNPNENLLGDLADETGGEYFPAPTEQDIADAYASVKALLTSEYLITIPETDITDCDEHELEVTVTVPGNPPVIETTTKFFTRRQCDTAPNPFTFTDQTNVRVGAAVTSNAVTISGIEVGAHISVLQGRYSIGCTDTFTNEPATITDGQTVCVRHTASSEPGTSRTTTLTIGGVVGTFTTTTRSESSGGGGGGGGGTTGVPELLAGLGALLLARRRRAA